MPNEINNVSTASTAPSQVFEQFQKLAGDSTKAKEVIGKAMEVLAGANIKVTRADTTGADGVSERKTTGATSTPALDNPADIKQVEANLEKLIAYLQLDNEKRQAEMAKDRIDMQKATLEKEHQGRMSKINDTLKKMDKAQSASKWSRLFGWLGAIVAVIAAVVTTVVTGGAAAGFAIAGAAMAVTNLALNETGAMEKITEKLAEHLEKNCGASASKAKMWAGIIVNGGMMALQIGLSVTSVVQAFRAAGQVAATAISVAGKTAQNIVGLSGLAVGLGAQASGLATTITGFNAQMAQSKVTELEKYLQQMQQCLDESQEELEQILQQLQSGMGKVAEILTSATDTSAEISRKLGAMA